MMGFDSRAARAAWSVFLVALLLAILYLIRKTLLVFILAVLFAYLLAPVLNLVDRLMPWRRSRPYSLAIVYILLVAALIAGGFLIGDKVAQEASMLAERFPTIMDDVRQRLAAPGPAWLEPVKHYLSNLINQRGGNFGAAIMPLMQTAGAHAMSVLSSVLFIVLIPILAFFFLKDGRNLKDNVLAFAVSRRAMWEDILADLHVLLGQFIRALVLVSIVTLVVYSIVFTILGVPYGALLATVAALLEFIPVIGPLVAAVLICIVAAFSGAGHILVILAFLGLYRLFQDYVLVPHLMSSGVELHPLLVIFGALAGEQIAGIPGMFLSVPVLATLRVIFVRIRKTRVEPSPEAAPVHEPPATIIADHE